MDPLTVPIRRNVERKLQSNGKKFSWIGFYIVLNPIDSIIFNLLFMWKTI